MSSADLPPFTDAHRRAVRDCRFVTPNTIRTRAWAITPDVETVRVLVPGAGMTAAERAKAGSDEHPAVASATHYERARGSGAWEWELTFSHPDAVAFICDLIAERAVATL